MIIPVNWVKAVILKIASCVVKMSRHGHTICTAGKLQKAKFLQAFAMMQL